VCIPKKEEKMDVLEATRARRSIRRYKPEQISEKNLQTMLETARLAPSAANRQPRRFIIVQDAARKKAVAEATNDQTFFGRRVLERLPRAGKERPN